VLAVFNQLPFPPPVSVAALSDADFLNFLAAHERVVVKYYADWCGYCRLLAPRYEPLAETFPDLAFAKVNAEFNPQARRLGGVHHLPFFAAFYRGHLLQNRTASDEVTVREFVKGLPWPLTSL
jgi:thiol-disulfide isomerase/thioredoxin